MKKILALLLTLCMLAALAACGTEPTPTVPTDGTTTEPAASAESTADTTASTAAEKTPASYSVVTLKGPTGMGLASLMDKAAKGETTNTYSFTLAGDPTAVSASVIKGEVDVACVPVNLASVLYTKTNGAYVCAAVNTLGVLHILENGDSVQSIADLAGKTLYATGLGATPEYILNYILEKNGLTDKVTVEYKTEHSELAALLASGDVKLAMLPEPNVTSAMMQNPDLRLALDLTAEWDKVSDTSAVQGCVIVKKTAIEANPDAFADFLADYAASVAFVNANVEDAAALCETYGIVPKAAVAKRAYPNCNIVFVTGAEMKTALSAFLGVLYDANPASIGGALPADDFYYGAE